MQTAASWAKKVGGQEVPIFRQATGANFRQRRLWVLRSSILPLNSPKLGDFGPKFCIFWRKFSDKKKIFSRLKLGGTTTPLNVKLWTLLVSYITLLT